MQANHLDADVAAATEEVAADYAGRLMSDGDTMEQFIQQNQHRPSLLKRMAEAFRELWRKLTGKERTQAEEAAYRLEKAYEKAVKEAKKNAAQTGGGERLSIENLGGEMITVIDTRNDTRQYDVAEAYLNTLVNAEHPFSTVLKDSLPVYLGKDLPGEYRGSEYTKSMESRLRNVKMQAATNLDEMLLLADDGEWRENVKAKHAVDAKNGWYRYETQFAVPILNAQKVVDHYTVYSGTLLIRNDADGKSYLYDLVNIAKKKVISASSFSAKTHSEVKPPKPSDANVTHPVQNVNTKFSLRQPVEGQNVNNNLSKKERQFQTIQQSNPAADEYHTWIRSADEIRTFEEVLADPEWDYSEFDPDYTRAMAEEALQSGEITVYSSYPISEGVFVSPSRMEAESYSGSGKVYSETVSLDDVAWIDPTQGQYAPIDAQTDTSSRQSLRADAELEAAVQEIQQKREAGEISAEEARAQIIQKGEEAYQRMIERYGEIQQGEKPARQISVPKQTNKDTRVTQTIRTVLEARVTPDMAVPDIKTMVANGTFSYEVIGDKATLSEAKGKIANDGWANAYSEWMQSMKKGVYSKLNTALGAGLYNNAVNHGDIPVAMDILMELAASQRAAGQVVQATKIIKQLSPEAQLFGAARSVKSIQEELNQRYGNEKAPTLIIREDLAEQYMKANTEQEREKVLNDIYKNIGEQIPPTFADKWNAWRYLAMLGNPRTQIRNVFGNLFFAPVVMAKNAVGMTIVEPVGRLLSEDKSGRSKAFYTRELYRAALGDYANVESEIMNGTKYNDSAMQNSAIRDGQRVFRFKLLEARLKLPGLKEAAERLHRQPSAEGYSVKGRRTRARLFIPDLVFPEHIEMGENIFLYFGDMTECYVLYWLRQF